MKKQDVDKLWQDKKNWSALGFYSCKDDPRVVVPKCVRWMGWTINVAHAQAWWVLLLMIFLGVVPAIGLIILGQESVAAVLCAVGFSVVAVVGLSVWLSNRY